MTSMLPERVTITDDTMREGLQIERPDIPVEQKLRLLDALGETGAKVISIGSFAHPKWTPAMADIEELAERFEPKPGVTYTAAIFNRKGFERADRFYPKIDVRSRGFTTAAEVSDSFARRNYNRTKAQQLASADGIIERARESGAESGTVGIGSPWGCNFEGPFTLAQQLETIGEMVEKWHNGGFEVKKVSISDAMGWNTPHRVKESIVAIRDTWPEVEKFHLHLAQHPGRDDCQLLRGPAARGRQLRHVDRRHGRAAPTAATADRRVTCPPRTSSTCVTRWALRPAMTCRS